MTYKLGTVYSGKEAVLKFDHISVGTVNAFFNISPGKFQRKITFELNLDRNGIVIGIVEGGGYSSQNIQDEESPGNIT